MRLDELSRLGIAVPAEAAALRLRAATADSRRAGPGCVFFALPGARTDGRAHIADAVRRGAVAVVAPPGTSWPEGAAPRPLLEAADPRRALALLLARLSPGQPAAVVAVTGTDGKTSTADFLRQMAALSGRRAASVGTLGLVAAGFPAGPSLTTPDPQTLHATLAALADAGVEALAMEASSHGLDQRRLDGVRLAGAGFTNLSRDHLDYHGTPAAYRAAKLRLFDALLPPGAPAAAMADLDAPTLAALRAIAARRGLALRLARVTDWRALPHGQSFAIEGRAVEMRIPGRFQADNAALAALLAPALGVADPLALLPRLAGVRGRMELAATLPGGAAVFVDYAHTPDAVGRLLEALRPHVAPGARLHVLLGAGGDRDPGKRGPMGAAAARRADRVWVTDDNPRSEDPAAIRAAVLAGAPGAVDAGAREAAIARALAALGPGDVLAVAGKGHEQGQTIGDETLPFDDAAVVRRLAGCAP